MPEAPGWELQPPPEEAGAPGVSLSVVRRRILSSPPSGPLEDALQKGGVDVSFSTFFVESQNCVLSVFLFGWFVFSLDQPFLAVLGAWSVWSGAQAPLTQPGGRGCSLLTSSVTVFCTFS